MSTGVCVCFWRGNVLLKYLIIGFVVTWSHKFEPQLVYTYSRCTDYSQVMCVLTCLNISPVCCRQTLHHKHRPHTSSNQRLCVCVCVSSCECVRHPLHCRGSCYITLLPRRHNPSLSLPPWIIPPSVVMVTPALPQRHTWPRHPSFWCTLCTWFACQIAEVCDFTRWKLWAIWPRPRIFNPS